MAPITSLTVEWQTDQIIKCLFDDQFNLECRSLDAGLEVDSAICDDDPFDPVIIAEKLKSVGDDLMDNLEFRAALAGLKQAVAKEAIETAFSRGVEAIRKTHVCQQPEVSSEMQLINASVAFGLYLQKSSPELKMRIQRVMSEFITSHVGPWLTQQGGWGNVV